MALAKAMTTEQLKELMDDLGEIRPDTAYVKDATTGKWREVIAADHPDSAADSHPIDVILYCPQCKNLHIDAPQPDDGWSNPPHRSHLCHFCGAIWRPAEVCTNGVARVGTRGAGDTWPPQGV